MASIKPLPEAVRSNVRSGIIVSDIARVVEELIYNSLDAGATKVSVFIGIVTCYVKVVDDGSGITRDGLVLLGERYATSKLNYLADMDTATGYFGYRGEALGSISDVSLLEIVTKAHGRPNGYRKVLKGCKCLYLGIDDDRQDVGTTVIVRDLFYNQPVRMKHMQSSCDLHNCIGSPKKLLHSVRKCVLYIALVHSNVSFKVVNIESEENILSTQPSSSPLPLLASSFGIETSSTLHELNLSDGVLELSGYISTPYETMSVKVLQCIYINARYVCNCLIHKLLNELATRFKCLDSVKDNSREPNGKRSRSQSYANYILNLSCPRSRYDLSFEPSKTSIEFKDWVPILTFIEKVITQFWSEKMAYGNSLSHAADILQKDETWEDDGKIALPPEDMLTESKIAKKACRIKNLQASNGDPSPPMEMLTQDNIHLLDKRDCGVPFQTLHKHTAEFEKKQTESRFVHQKEYSYKSWDDPPAKRTSMGNRESDNHLWTLDENFCSADNNFYNRTATEKSDDHEEDCFFGSTWGEDFPNVDPNLSGESTRTALSYTCFEFTKDAEEINKDFRKPFLQRCSIRESLPPDVFLARDKNLEFQNGSFRTKRKQCDPDNMINVVGIGGSDKSVDIFPGNLWQDVAVSAQPSAKLRSNSDLFTDVHFSRDSMKSYSFDKCFVEDDYFSPNSATNITNFGSARHSLNFESHPLTSDPLLGKTSWHVEHLTHENEHKWDLGSSKGALCGDFANIEDNNCMLSYDPILLNDLSKENCLSSSCISDRLDFKGYAGPKRDVRKFLHGHISEDIFSPRCSNILAEETDWFCLNSSNKDLSDNCAGHISDDIFSPRSSNILAEETDWFCSNSSNKDLSDNCAVSSHSIPTHSVHPKINKSELLRYKNCDQYRRDKRISRRSQSAPPFYRSKKLFALKDHFTIAAEKQKAETLFEASTCPGISEAKNLQQSSGAYYMYSKQNSGKDSLLDVRPDIKTMPDVTCDKKEVQKGEKFEESPHYGIFIASSIKDFIPIATEEHRDSRVKWRSSCLQDGKDSRDVQNQCNILDISSGILYLASDSLVPEINKKCLEHTKVLQQVDKKFIPIVASGTLAIIDQHAADERIRLEELRQKVLSGEVKTITYLDVEQELVLPEIGYQLLENYAEQIQNWGWICNIHAQGFKSFAKNMNLLQKRPAVVTLLTVPCILGVNLSDVDLLEFLQQLADTDGSSTMPPSVLRVLNSKACRGAIMFGDTLLPSECSLIVEELKQTSLCFQCAHGRPTTIPLINLEALHRQINKLVLLNDGSNESWHGLRRQKISSKRAAERLASARS